MAYSGFTQRGLEPNGRGRGRMLGAVAAGVAVGIAANFGRKLAVQAMSGMAGDWFEALKVEHRKALAIFDRIERTRDDQTFQRTLLLMQLKHALSKHMLEEEDVIYPALRQADSKQAADKLNHDHAYVKTFLYDLLNLPKDDPQWLSSAPWSRIISARRKTIFSPPSGPRCRRSRTPSSRRWSTRKGWRWHKRLFGNAAVEGR